MKRRRPWKHIGSAIAGFIYPATCFHCRRFIAYQSPVSLCDACRKKLPRNEPPFCPACGRHRGPEHGARPCSGGTSHLDEIFFMLHYRGLARKLIQRFKINRSAPAIRILKVHLRQFLGASTSWRGRYEVLTPIPPSGSTLPLGGWKPAAVLSRQVSAITGIPVKPWVKRSRRMKKQSALNRRERLDNVRDAFRLPADSRQVANRSILLVDDVITTAATAAECARLLKDQGATRVGILAAARGVA